MPGDLNVSLIVGLVDRVTAPLRGMRANLERTLATTANMTFIGGALQQAGAQALAPMRQAVLEAGALGSVLTEVGIVAEVAGERLRAVRPELRALAEQTNQYTTDLATGLKDLTARGMGFDAALAVLPGIAQATTAAKAAMTDMTGLSSALVQNLEIAPNTAGINRALGMLIQAGNEGQFELNSMAQYFPLLTGGMRNIALVGEDAVATVGAALQVVRQATGEDSQAANYMANLLAKMTAPLTVKNVEKFWGMDLEAQFRSWRAQGLNVFDEFIALVRAKTQGDPFKLSEVFQDMEVLGALKPLLADMERVEAIRAKALGAADTAGAAQFARRTGEDPTEGWKALGIVLANLGDQVGDALLPAVKGLVEWLRAALIPIGAWVKEHPALTAGILGTVGAASGLMVVLGGLLTGLAGVIGAVALMGLSLGGLAAPLGWLVSGAGMAGRGLVLLGLGLRGLGPLLLNLGRLLLLTPLGWLIATLGAAIYVFTHWEETVEAASRAYGRLVEWLGVDPVGAALAYWQQFTDWLSSTFATALDAAGRAYERLVAWLGVDPVGAALAYWQQFTDWLSSTFATALDAAGRAYGRLVEWLGVDPVGAALAYWRQFAGWLSSTFGSALDAASRAYERLVAWLGVDPVGAALAHWQQFAGWLSSTFGSALDAASRAYDGLTAAASAAVDAVRDRWSGLLAWLQGLPGQMLALAGRVGQSLVDGLIAPLEAGWARVRAAASRLTGGLIGASREEADAHSPSRAMIALGSDLVRGLEIGIEARKRFAQGALAGTLALGAVTAGAQIPEPGAASPAPRAAGPFRVEMPITINISAPPGTDTHALAALVRREVEQATRQATGRIARLYDVSDGL